MYERRCELMLDLFVEIDEAKELRDFALDVNWIKTNVNELFLQQYQETMKLENPIRQTKPGFIRPSSLTNCLRKLVFEYLGTPEELHYDGSPRIGESGSDAHTRIQNYIINMKEHGYDVEYMSVKDYLELFPNDNLEIINESDGHEVIKVDIEKNTIEYKHNGKVRTQPLLAYMERYHGPETLVYNKATHSRFKVDGIVKYKGEYYILEIKTENSKKYASHNKTFEPHEKHKLQGTFYGMSFGINKVMFLYENRDSCATFITIFDITKVILDKVKLLIEETLRYGENDWVAPRTIDKFECKYCPYQARCSALGESLPR